MQNTQNISALLQQMSPAKSLGFLIQDVARLLRREMDQKAQKLGLTSAQWRILAHVSRCELLNQEPLNQASLAELLDMEPITLSRHIDRIQAAGLIERRPHPSDGGAPALPDRQRAAARHFVPRRRSGSPRACACRGLRGGNPAADHADRADTDKPYRQV